MKLRVMNVFTLILILCLGLATNPAWSQDTTSTETPQEEDTSSTEEASAEPEEKKKPVRLSGKIPRQRNPSDEQGSMKLLADYLPKDAPIWLETDDGPFLALWQEDRSGFPKGALLIIHAEGEHPAWPNTTKPLHDTLPDYGWATLAVSLPPPDKPEQPKRTLPVKVKRMVVNKEEGANEESSDDSEPQEAAAEEPTTTESEPTTTASALPMQQDKQDSMRASKMSAEDITEKRLESALRFLHDQGQFNLIILGNGSGAIRAHDFVEKITPKIDNPRLKAKVERPVRAMILVNGRNQLPSMADNYEGWFSDPEIPILDIFVPTGYRNKEDAAYRKILAKRKKVTVYKQVRLTSFNAGKSWKENVLSRRVRSFLDTNAVGIEVKNAKLRRYN